jgi:hypothetical protein
VRRKVAPNRVLPASNFLPRHPVGGDHRPVARLTARPPWRQMARAQHWRPKEERMAAQLGQGNPGRGFWLGVVAMIIVVGSSNFAVMYAINDWLTWGAFTYPLAFLVTDLTNRALGGARARQVVYIGFALAVALSIWLATPRIALASGLAFLCAQLLDIAIFDRLRRARWWWAPLISSVFASVLDTLVFFSLAFAGTGLPWVTWALGDYGVKLAMALVLLMPFRALMPAIRAQPAAA